MPNCKCVTCVCEPSAVIATLQTLAIVQAIGEIDGERRQREMHHVRAAIHHSGRLLALAAAALSGPRSARPAGFLSHERRYRAACALHCICAAWRAMRTRAQARPALFYRLAVGRLLLYELAWKVRRHPARTRAATSARTRLLLRGSQGLVWSAGTRYEAARACVCARIARVAAGGDLPLGQRIIPPQPWPSLRARTSRVICACGRCAGPAPRCIPSEATHLGDGGAGRA